MCLKASCGPPLGPSNSVPLDTIYMLMINSIGIDNDRANPKIKTILTLEEWPINCLINLVKTLKPLNFILIALFGTIFVSCTQNNDSKISKLPQIINEEEGLREFRFRRYDCLHMPYNETEENCTHSEEIIEEPSVTTPGSSNLRINELTPWLQNKSRTVINPTVMYNDTTEKMFVTSYLRMNDAQGVQQNYKFKFEGNLKTFRDRFRRTGEKEYLRLIKKESESTEIVNAVVYCYDNPTCKDITLVFSFLNYDEEGKSFIDSRPFQLDQREEPVAASDVLPGQAIRTIETPVIEDEEVEEDEYIDEEHLDPAFSASPVGPALPQDKSDSLCMGLINNSEDCPDYLLDSSIPRLSEEEVRKEETLEPNPIESIVEINQLQQPTIIDTPIIRPVDEQVFPAESRILAPEMPRLVEPNIDVLPSPNQTNYDISEYHQFILRERQIREQALMDAKAQGAIETPKLTIQDGAIPRSATEEEKVPESDSTEVAVQPSVPRIRPRARPDHLVQDRQVIQDAPITAPEEVVEPAAPVEPVSPLAVSRSLRPLPRPEGLAERYRLAAEEAARLAAIEAQRVAADVPFESIDGQFTYDLGKCGEHLVQAKNIEYNQARGFYTNGSLRNASHYGESEYEPNYADPNRTNRHYSSEITKQVLEFVGCVMAQRYGDNIKIVIKDFSDHNGGRLGRHSSHQNGLDVDVSYPHLNGTTNGFDDFASNITNNRLGAAFDYARLLLYTDRVHIIFTDNRIRGRFCTYLREKGKLSDFRNVVERYMYHVRSHHHHYHVRMKCNIQNEGCTVQGNFADDNYCSR